VGGEEDYLELKIFLIFLFFFLFFFFSSAIRTFLDHIHNHKKENAKKDYNLFFVPRRTMICEKILEEEGVYGGMILFFLSHLFPSNILPSHLELQFGEFNLDLIPFDDDVLSLELETSFRELYLVAASKILIVSSSAHPFFSFFLVSPLLGWGPDVSLLCCKVIDEDADHFWRDPENPGQGNLRQSSYFIFFFALPHPSHRSFLLPACG